EDVRARQPARELAAVPDVSGQDDAFVAESLDRVAKRALADQRELRPELLRQPAKRVDHHIGLLLTVEPADVDEQRLIVGEAELAPQPRVAAVRSEFAELNPERHDLEILDAEAPELRRATIVAQGEDGVETAVERTAIGITGAAEQAGDPATEHLRGG